MVNAPTTGVVGVVGELLLPPPHAMPRQVEPSTHEAASRRTGDIRALSPTSTVLVSHTEREYLSLGGTVFRMLERMMPQTSADKALHLLEVLSSEPGGMALRDLARATGLPAATAHRLLLVLRRRGFVRQEGEGGHYILTLKLLDMSFRYLNGSELRLHAYPPLREYVGRTATRAFVSLPAGEVTYVWDGQDDAAAMYTAYGKTMPGHCSLFFAEGQQRRLSCARLCGAGDVARSSEVVRRFGDGGAADGYRLNCACAPVRDYRGQEVARMGVFTHGRGEGPLHEEHVTAAWDLARATSVRLGYLSAEVGPTTPARLREAGPQQ